MFAQMWLKSYFEYEIVTKIITYSETDSEFPSVSFCNLFPFSNDTTDITRGILQSQKPRNDSGPPPISYLPSNKNSRIASMESFYVVQSNLYLANETFKKSISYSLNELVLSCRFGQQDCDLSKFDWYYDKLLGNCYRFNSVLMKNKDPLRVSQSGVLNGLQMELFLGLEEKMAPWLFTSGMRIFVHNASVIPSSDEGIDISPGSKTNIAVSREFDYNLPEPYSRCILLDNGFASDLYNLTIRLNQTYRQRFEFFLINTNINKLFLYNNQRDCQELCIQREVIRECGCAMPFVYDFSFQSKCTTFNQSDCIRDVVYANISKIVEDCDECPLECSSVRYKLVRSFADYPTAAHAAQIIQSNKSILHRNVISDYQSNLTSIRGSFLAFNVYYSDLSYTEISALPKITPVDFICGLGGNVGLFIGASFLTLVELVEALGFIVYCVYIYFFQNKISHI